MTNPSSRATSAAARRIAGHWSLSDFEAASLLGIAEREVERFYTQPDSAVAATTRHRVAILIYIWETLTTLFGAGAIADGWIRRPNRDFCDRLPLEIMMTGRLEDLDAIREYLSAARNA